MEVILYRLDWPEIAWLRASRFQNLLGGGQGEPPEPHIGVQTTERIDILNPPSRQIPLDLGLDPPR
jgi:hypothetical protein